MTVKQFAQKYKFKNSEKAIVEKLYGQEERSEAAWISTLKNEISFDSSSFVEEEPKTKPKK